jgi:hypothetical protein
MICVKKDVRTCIRDMKLYNISVFLKAWCDRYILSKLHSSYKQLVMHVGVD